MLFSLSLSLSILSQHVYNGSMAHTGSIICVEVIHRFVVYIDCASSEIPRSCDGAETTKQAASCGQRRRQRSLETPVVSCLEALHYSWQTDRSTPRRGALLVVASHQRFPHPIHHTVPVSEAVRQRELPAVVQEEPVHLPLPLGRCLSPNLSLFNETRTN
jgi:hypothetical protein